MTPQFQYAIVGRGLTGSAAARHLAEQVPGVLLVGPDEPAARATHEGVFASHYDEGRITRTIDPDETWARMANRSIQRYRELEARSGIGFFSEEGCLFAGLKSGESAQSLANVREAAERLGVECVRLDDDGLKERFGYFRFPAGSDGVFEASGAGHLSPRNLVAAQTRLAEQSGCTVIRQQVETIRQGEDHADIVMADGRTVTAGKVLVAAGGFTNRPGLLPEPLDLVVYARTVAFFEVDEAEAVRLAGMPSMIYRPEDAMHGIYMLPPIRYPDGRIYLKIGGDPIDVPLETEGEIRAWFRGGGDARATEYFVEKMKEFVPDLGIRAIHAESCVTSFTPTGYPAIGWTSQPSIAVMAGGCGAAAKSSDEIGRLGAELVLHGRIIDAAYRADFEPQFL